MSRALANLTDRLIWPYCLPLMEERCLELHEEVDGAHEAYQRYAKHNAANPIASDLHDHLLLARLLGGSLLGFRDHPPRRLDCNVRVTNDVFSVQDWLATRGMTQPLAQRWGRNGSSVSKETVVETLRNNLADLDGRCSYAASHKCHSAAWHWSRCIVVDHPDVTVQWEDTVCAPLVDLWLDVSAV